MAIKNKSPLLELINERKVWMLPATYQAPTSSEAYNGRVREAVACIVNAGGSDPFEAKRAKLHMERGFTLPSEVLADCKKAKGLRASERRYTPAQDALAQVKRKLDADRAWNQHNSAMFLA
jgi:hypothetical protein